MMARQEQSDRNEASMPARHFGMCDRDSKRTDAVPARGPMADDVGLSTVSHLASVYTATSMWPRQVTSDGTRPTPCLVPTDRALAPKREFMEQD